jgi:processive 1,2-diacylglycerol beta-glucosyltransferase
LVRELSVLVRHRPEDFRILGYTDEMPDLMGAATILLSKPGGMTTAEALACGLPMVILDPIGGQEERNADVLLEAGAAVKCTEVTVVAHKLKKLLGNPDRLRAMSENARALGRPSAARDIASLVLDAPHRDHAKISKLRAKALRKRITEG